MKSYIDFVNNIYIPTPEPQLFKEVAKDWQKHDSAILNGILMRATTNNFEYPYRHACFIRPRGCDKTSSIARAVLWSILDRKDSIIHGFACAVDQDQAKLIQEAITEILILNPELQKRVKIYRSKSNSKVIGDNGYVKIMSSDAASAWGKRPSLIIFDELTHWESDRSKRFFDAMFSSIPKNPKSCCIIISNAGYKDTWQYNLISELKNTKEWYVYDEPGRPNTWMNDEDIALASKGMDDKEIRRVFYNEWVTRSSSRIVSEYLKLCKYPENKYGSSNRWYSIGVDFGYSKSLTAMSVVHIDQGENVIVDCIEAYSSLQSREFENKLYDLIARFPNCVITIDPYQTLFIIEKLSKEGKKVRIVKPSSEYNKRVLNQLVSLIMTERIYFPIVTGLCKGKSLSYEMENIFVGEESGLVSFNKNTKNKDRIMSLCYAIEGLSETPRYEIITVGNIEQQYIIREKYNPFGSSFNNEKRLFG